MNEFKNPKIVIFGAGKIGLSFIGQLFSRGGYEVVFVDIDKNIIYQLNKHKYYKVVIKSETDEIIKITNVRGILAENTLTVTCEVATAALIAICVGQKGLNSVFPLLAKGLLDRHKIDNQLALDIIIAENIRNADLFFRTEIKKSLPFEYPFDTLVGLVETSIGKMVPNMIKKDVNADCLQVFAEPYNTLILDKMAFKNEIPQIEGLAAKENMKAWVDRKLFIHNLGHATTAYVSHLYNAEFIYLYEGLDVPIIRDAVKKIMQQSADVLIQKYPNEFTREDLDNHITDLLYRFQNRELEDTIFRVGCDLFRKLGPEDRLVGIIKDAITYKLPYSKILFSLVCGFHFRASDENMQMIPSDIEFENQYNKGVDHVLRFICGFDYEHYSCLFYEAQLIDNQINSFLDFDYFDICKFGIV